jgi:hypothetical protein
MSLYRHKRTEVLYRTLFGAFNVENQEHQWVYMSLQTGEIFTRGQIAFAQNFELLNANPQSSIMPKEIKKGGCSSCSGQCSSQS